MTFAAWMELLTAIFKSPEAILALVRVFQATPEEQRQAMVAKVQADAAQFQKTGRPVWD